MNSFREGFKKIVEFFTQRLTPPFSEKKERKNDLRVMKQILYYMGPLTLVKLLLQRAFKLKPMFSGDFS